MHRGFISHLNSLCCYLDSIPCSHKHVLSSLGIFFWFYHKTSILLVPFSLVMTRHNIHHSRLPIRQKLSHVPSSVVLTLLMAVLFLRTRMVPSLGSTHSAYSNWPFETTWTALLLHGHPLYYRPFLLTSVLSLHIGFPPFSYCSSCSKLTSKTILSHLKT